MHSFKPSFVSDLQNAQKLESDATKLGSVLGSIASSQKEKKKSSPGVFKPKAILHKSKQVDYNVYYNGEEVTPKPLNPDMVYKGVKERPINVINMSGIETSTTQFEVQKSRSYTYSGGKFKTEMTAVDNRSYLGTNLESTFLLQSIMTEEESEPEEEREEDRYEEKELGKTFIDRMPIPETISLILNETDTIFLLDLPSVTVEKETEEGYVVHAENESYDYLTVGKGRNRRTISMGIQTRGIMKKTRDTEAFNRKTKSSTTSASNWEMYDTFKAMHSQETEQQQDNEKPDSRTLDTLHKLNDSQSIESLRQSREEKQLQKIVLGSKFQQAACVIERMLANNTYNEKQKRFKGLIETDVFRENITYKYHLDLLWTFANNKTKGKCPTALHWNRKNEDIVVVGYGIFYFTDKANGMIMVWNIKNPVQPERFYEFVEPVSAVSFSLHRPSLLAVGFVNGSIKILDIHYRKLTVIDQSSRDSSTSYECVNYIQFYSGDEHYNYEEQVLACFNDGRVCKYRLSDVGFMPCIQIMRAPESDGKIKGITKMAVCGVPPIPLSKYTGVKLLCMHPVDPYIYYVCTNTGVIHKCSTNYFNQHLDLMLAHDGPIYCMRFSPFCNKVYVTCGGDWYVRIWAEGITEPLLELHTRMYPVESVIWSPTHSTVLVSIQGSDIHIWDLQRKIHYPQNTIKSPTDARNTICRFTRNGKCLVVSDTEGHVHIFALEDMPIPAFFQDHLLDQAIKKALVTRPELLKKYEALKSVNFEKSGTQRNVLKNRELTESDADKSDKL